MQEGCRDYFSGRRRKEPRRRRGLRGQRAVREIGPREERREASWPRSSGIPEWRQISSVQVPLLAQAPLPLTPLHPPASSSLLSKKLSQTLSPLSSGLHGSGATRGGGPGALGLLPVSLAGARQGVWPGCGPSPSKWELRPREEESRARGGLEVPSHPHSPTSHLPWGHIWARGNSMGQPEKGAPGAGCVCMGSQKVCILSNSSLLSPQPPGAGNVASPTALAFAEDSRHGKP